MIVSDKRPVAMETGNHGNGYRTCPVPPTYYYFWTVIKSPATALGNLIELSWVTFPMYTFLCLFIYLCLFVCLLVGWFITRFPSITVSVGGIYLFI